MKELSAYCASCHSDQPVETKYLSEQTDQKATTDVICQQCGKVIATFSGKVLIESESSGITLI
jgi:hypothetical protein